MGEASVSQRLLDKLGAEFENDADEQKVFVRKLSLVNSIRLGFFLAANLDQLANTMAGGKIVLTPHNNLDTHTQNAVERQQRGEPHIYGPVPVANGTFTVRVINGDAEADEFDVEAATDRTLAGSPILGHEVLLEILDATISRTTFD